MKKSGSQKSRDTLPLIVFPISLPALYYVIFLFLFRAWKSKIFPCSCSPIYSKSYEASDVMKWYTIHMVTDGPAYLSYFNTSELLEYQRNSSTRIVLSYIHLCNIKTVYVLYNIYYLDGWIFKIFLTNSNWEKAFLGQKDGENFSLKQKFVLLSWYGYCITVYNTYSPILSSCVVCSDNGSIPAAGCPGLQFCLLSIYTESPAQWA